MKDRKKDREIDTKKPRKKNVAEAMLVNRPKEVGIECTNGGVRLKEHGQFISGYRRKGT